MHKYVDRIPLNAVGVYTPLLTLVNYTMTLTHTNYITHITLLYYLYAPPPRYLVLIFRIFSVEYILTWQLLCWASKPF